VACPARLKRAHGDADIPLIDPKGSAVKGIVVVAVCILAAMIAVKDGRLFRTTGLTATCTKVASVPGADVEACRPGKLEGRPDLTKRGCKFVATYKQLAYWRCPSDTQPDN
jgi:hypothetical protein